MSIKIKFFSFSLGSVLFFRSFRMNQVFIVHITFVLASIQVIVVYCIKRYNKVAFVISVKCDFCSPSAAYLMICSCARQTYGTQAYRAKIILIA